MGGTREAKRFTWLTNVFFSIFFSLQFSYTLKAIDLLTADKDLIRVGGSQQPQ